MLGAMLSGSCRVTRRARRRRCRPAARGPLAVARVPDEPGATSCPTRADTPGGGRGPRRRRSAGGRAARRRGRGSPVDRGVARGPRRLDARRAAGDRRARHGRAGELAYARRPVRLLVRRADGGRTHHPRAPAGVRGAGGSRRVLPLPRRRRACRRMLCDLGAVADPARRGGRGARHRSRRRRDRRAARHVCAPPARRRQQPDSGRVFRWADGRFAPPTSTELGRLGRARPSSSGTATASRATRPRSSAAPLSTCCSAMSLGPTTRLVVEDSGLVATDARRRAGRRWARHRRAARRRVQVRAVAARRGPRGAGGGGALADGRFLGVVRPRRAAPARAPERPEPLHVLCLPNLTPPRGNAITRSPAAAALEPVGSPRTSARFRAAVSTASRRSCTPAPPSLGRPPDAPFATRQAALFGTSAGAEPDRTRRSRPAWHAIWHGAGARARP